MPETPSESRLQSELRDYYGPLLPHWDRSLENRGDLSFWDRAASAGPDRPILELGAGSGRITRVLVRSGRPVVALDLNPEAVRRARRRLADQGGVHLLVADMRTFRLAGRFELVAAGNDPFCHLRTDEGRDRALARVAEHLEPEGRFLLDALWFSEEWLEEAAGSGGKTVRTSIGGEGDDPPLEVRQRWRCDPSERLCVARYEVREPGGEPASSSFRGRYWSASELEARLDRAGLRIRHRWGGYDGSEWSPGASHLVVEAVPA